MDEKFKDFVRDKFRAGVRVSHVIVEYLDEGCLIVVKFSSGATFRFILNVNTWELHHVFEAIETIEREVKNESRTES